MELDLASKGSNGSTALHYVVESGQEDTAKVTLNNEADPNEQNYSSWTALSKAMEAVNYDTWYDKSCRVSTPSQFHLITLKRQNRSTPNLR